MVECRSISVEVVLADLGIAELRCPQDRMMQVRARLRDWPTDTVPVCTPSYRPPDVLLGSLSFDADLDMWSAGCVAAELWVREPLFPQRDDVAFLCPLLIAHFEFLGTPAPLTSELAWLKALPFFEKFCGRDGQRLKGIRSPEIWPPKCLRSCPPQLTDFVRKTLQLHPQERLTAASASMHSFLVSSALFVRVASCNGKNGPGSIIQGSIDDDVLDYLQKCPTWEKWHAECLANNFAPNDCISRAEGKKRMKSEFVGFVDANNAPKCKSLNGDVQLKFIGSERLGFFVLAMRRVAHAWLHQLTARVRAAILREHLPSAFLKDNGPPFMEEDFADNTFAYASVQLLRVAPREDGWHTDGGASLLHASVTLFGSREVQVKTSYGLEERCISLIQKPGSFYMGSMTALEHNVVHHDEPEGPLYQGSDRAEIAVMLRCDVFRKCRARKINAVPGPTELFRIVNAEVARHLAEVPFHLPDFAAVIAESRRAAPSKPEAASA